MGTKRNPGRFDYYAKAKEDEPMFVLLARDPYASTLVRIWKLMHEDNIDCDKADEAILCADLMDAWKEEHGDFIGLSHQQCQNKPYGIQCVRPSGHESGISPCYGYIEGVGHYLLQDERLKSDPPKDAKR